MTPHSRGSITAEHPITCATVAVSVLPLIAVAVVRVLAPSKGLRGQLQVQLALQLPG